MALTDLLRRPPKATSTEVLTALAHHPYGLTTDQLASHLKISAAEAAEHLQTLHAEHWLTIRFPRAHGDELVDPDDPRPRDSAPWSLNPHRPGFDTFMDWLEIHHGISTSAVRTALDDPRPERSDPHNAQTPVTDPRVDQARAALANARHSIPLAPSLYRAAAAEARPLWNLPAQIHQKALFLYYNVPGRDRYERYRDYVHQTGTLTDNLPAFPVDPGPETTDARAHLLALIDTLADYSHILTGLGDYYITADTLGHSRNLHTTQLARWAYAALTDNQADNPPPVPTTEPEAHEHHLRLQETLDLIDAGHTHGPLKNQAYYRVGGTPDAHDLGTAGEGILAATCYQHAADAAALLRRLETLPHMPETLAATGDNRPSNTLPANPFGPEAGD